MGFSKNPRSGKRYSNSSYSSAVSVVIFIAFCLLGVWMLTSTSVIPPQAQKQTLSTSSRIESKDSSSSSLLDETTAADLMEDTEKIPDSYHSNSRKSEEDLGRRALRPPIDEEEERQVEQPTAIESDDTKRSESGGGTEGAGDVETAADVGDEKQPEIEDKPKEEDQRDNFKDDEKQQPTEDGEEREAATREDLEKESDLNTAESDKDDEDKTDESVENQLLSQTDEFQQQSHTEEVVESQQQPETEENVENEQPQIEETVENQEPQTGGNTRTQQSKPEEGAENQSPLTEERGEGQKSETDEKVKHLNSNELFPDGAQSDISRESNVEQGSWATQADQSENEKARQKGTSVPEEVANKSVEDQDGAPYRWELCNVTAGPNFIPCLDNEKALKQLHSYKHFEHRERHCPDEGPTCLVPLPKGYRRSIGWPKSRDKIWYSNVPSTKLAVVKGHQNWVKVTGEYLTFPGGGTQFIHGALHYIDFIQQSLPNIAWGKRTRVILDVGCGVASFGGFLFERNVLAMSFAPKDEHEAQVQFALERGIPAISAVMGSKRLPFPSGVFDIVHCARCRVPWHAEGGALLLELNRVLRPGGYFVWSATPVYQKLKEDVEIWKAMSALTISMCWDLFTIKKDKLNSIGAAIYRKPTSNECYESRKHNNPPMCEEKDDPDAAWYVPLQSCMHRVPEDSVQRGSQWPEEWPVRLQTPPYWLNRSQVGVYGRPAPEDFLSDYQHWKQVLSKSYLNGLGIDWSTVRNAMDMRAVYGGFAAALRDLKVWVMNVVNVDSPDTLPIIYERGLFGIYHDWCESFSTYPRTYDLLHADTLFSSLKDRCNIVAVMAEIDRILRPGGKLIVRDESGSVSEIESLVKSLHWEVRLTYSKDHKGILCAQKTDWRPETFSAPL